MPEPRVLITEPIAAGVRLHLEADRARHFTTVLRLSSGAAVRVFNSHDGEWSARIETVGKRGLDLVVQTHLRAASATPDLDLLFAPVKRHATDLIVEKATELGVRRIRPVITGRTIAETVRLDRLALIAREAAEQTERFDAPEILPPLALRKVLDGWDATRLLVYAEEADDDEGRTWGSEPGRARPILEALQDRLPSLDLQRQRQLTSASPSSGAAHADRTPPPLPAPQEGERLSLLVGPEGGFDPAERRMLRALPFVLPVSLGPRILRTETAVVAALGVLQSAWGDW